MFSLSLKNNNKNTYKRVTIVGKKKKRVFIFNVNYITETLTLLLLLLFNPSALLQVVMDGLIIPFATFVTRLDLAPDSDGFLTSNQFSPSSNSSCLQILLLQRLLYLISFFKYVRFFLVFPTRFFVLNLYVPV